MRFRTGVEGECGGCTHFMHSRSLKTIAIRPPHSYNAGTEHVGFLPDQVDIACTNREGP